MGIEQGAARRVDDDWVSPAPSGGRLGLRSSASLTPEQLEAYAARVADRLRGDRLVRGETVAVYCSRGVALAVAAYGVEKAGGKLAIMNAVTAARQGESVFAHTDCCRVIATPDRRASLPGGPYKLYDLETMVGVPFLRVREM